MSKKEKRMILILLLILIVVIIAVVVIRMPKKGNGAQGENNEKYTTQLEDGTKLNTSSNFNEKKTYNGLEISNVQYTEKDGVTLMLADVKNTSNTKHEQEVVKITILGENGETITEFNAILKAIEPGATEKLNASVSANVANAKDYKIEPAQ